VLGDAAYGVETAFRATLAELGLIPVRINPDLF
jgi:SRSO17 transposase